MTGVRRPVRGVRPPAWRERIVVHERAIRDGLRMAAVIGSAGILVFAWSMPPDASYDTYAYYVARLSDPYVVSSAGEPGAFLYSPVVAQVLEPLRQLPWTIFHEVWVAVSLAALWYLVGPVLLVPTLVLWPFTLVELGFGNVNLWLAAAVVAGMRHPATWALVLLTKVTPGIGLLWFVVRREWRSLGLIAAVTAAIAGVSLVVAPSLWRDWVDVLVANQEAGPTALPPPLIVRLPAAALTVVWGARTDRAWTVPLAAALAIPVLSIVNLSMLVGVVAVLRRTGWRPC